MRKPGQPLPAPVCLALLRLLRSKPEHDDDEDILFDAFGTVGSEATIAAACSRLLRDSEVPIRDWRRRNATLDALLVDMVRIQLRPEREAA